MKTHVEELVKRWVEAYEAAYGQIAAWEPGIRAADIRMQMLMELENAIMLDKAEKVR
jgi:hypothetical protein